MAIDVVIPNNVPTSIQRDQMYDVRFVYSDQVPVRPETKSWNIWGAPMGIWGEASVFLVV